MGGIEGWGCKQSSLGRMQKAREWRDHQECGPQRLLPSISLIILWDLAMRGELLHLCQASVSFSVRTICCPHPGDVYVHVHTCMGMGTRQWRGRGLAGGAGNRQTMCSSLVQCPRVLVGVSSLLAVPGYIWPWRAMNVPQHKGKLKTLRFFFFFPSL